MYDHILHLLFFELGLFEDLLCMRGGEGVLICGGFCGFW